MTHFYHLGMTMAHYRYTRYSPQNKAYQEHVDAILKQVPEARHIQDNVHGFVPLRRADFTKHKQIARLLLEGSLGYRGSLHQCGGDES